MAMSVERRKPTTMKAKILRRFKLARAAAEADTEKSTKPPRERGSLFKSSKSVRDLIKTWQWSELERVLHTEGGRAQLLLGGGDGNDDGTVLHEACRRSAPLSVIQTICDILLPTSAASTKSLSLLPSILDERDRRGRTPLHCYAASASSRSRSLQRRCDYDDSSAGEPMTSTAADVVEYLLSRHPSGPAEAVAVQDFNGSTPLHLACGADRIVEDDNDDHLVHSFSDVLPANRPRLWNGPAVLALIRVLIRAHPSLVNDEDELGITPLEYAIISETPINVIKVLRTMSQRVWKKKKDKEAEAASYKSSSRVQQQLMRITSERKVKNGAQAA